MSVDSIKHSMEPTYKLYFPEPRPLSISLQDLITQNSVNLLGQDNKAFCGRCSCNTSQSASRSFSGKVIILEVMRVSICRGIPRKSSIGVTFSLRDYITVPGSSEKFRVIAVCHHSGSVNSGHWYSGIVLENGSWFMIDDLSTA